MDFSQQTLASSGMERCRLKMVNFQIQQNHISHETQGLGRNVLVVRRGKPFKLTLVFRSRLWNPDVENLLLEVLLLDELSEQIPVQFSNLWLDSLCWSARVYPGDIHSHSVTVHIRSPVLSAVALYQLFIHIETPWDRRSYKAGNFVLLCNPWLESDPVYMPLEVQLQEYVKSDFGVVFMGTNTNVSKRPWCFGQYDPGVLEACLKLLEVSPQHLRDRCMDYLRRADPVYLCRVLCAMVNSNDDMGVLEGRWQGSYRDGVKPTEWSCSTDILRHWVASRCKPVRYGQCWVFASVLCTVLRVLGVPSRVVTVFNSAHDGDGNLVTEEFYSSTGENLGLSKDSIWNFHVWVECWMRRPDLGPQFDGWQVVDPTPQEKSAGTYCCGPCPVVAVQQHCFGAPFDTSFIYASVDSDVVRMIVRDGLVVGRTVDTEWVGQLIYTKRIGSDGPENLTHTYKRKKRQTVNGGRMGAFTEHSFVASPSLQSDPVNQTALMSDTAQLFGASRSAGAQGLSPGLEVSLSLDGVPIVGNTINLQVTLTNRSTGSRVVREHLSAQVKKYHRSPLETLWKEHRDVQLQPLQELVLRHSIRPSVYESVLAGDDIMKVVVVVKDLKSKERVLDTLDFDVSSPQIHFEVEGGDTVQVKTSTTVLVSFTNRLSKALSAAVLTVEGSGLLTGQQQSRMLLLQPSDVIAKKVSITPSSPGTKLLMATFSHGKSPSVVSRCFHKVSVTDD
ncbi:protein-glutamine gamma-glutamyltransferase E-like [Synchiropus splendidus]|uniref:protein-glutamine gamma-glutamyltransferase E-like n=1 Tax=Synchiropus splendidus TaxID=270530 RepID=UPI00237DFA97|nr:protein-glutamine gamma-glutamyltransferase E-like [Synchiropus splendidus]